MKVTSSILDFPRKTLSEDIWAYSTGDKENELPQLKSSVKFLIESTAKNYLTQLGFTLTVCNLYGGSASYQWSKNADIDVSLYAKGWPESTTENDITKYQEMFKDIKILYKDHEIHFFLKNPKDPNIEVSEAVYDVLNDEWVLPPLILPRHFDPDEYFKPFLKIAEKKAKKFDEVIGKLRRSWDVLKKSAEAEKDAKEPDLVIERIEKEKETIRECIVWLSDTFMAIRDKRYAMHDALREKMKQHTEIGRLERFQEPEIVWKYLDRAGYTEFLQKLHKLISTNRLENILAAYP